MISITHLKDLGNLSNALLTIGKAKSDIDAISKSIIGLSTANKITALSASALSNEQKISILTSQGLTIEQAKTALATAALSSAQTTATATTGGLTAATKGLWATMKAHPFKKSTV